MRKFNFPVIIEVDEDGVYIVSCPLFKGCHSYGNTIKEAIQNIKEVIEMCLEEINPAFQKQSSSTKFTIQDKLCFYHQYLLSLLQYHKPF